MQRAVNYRQSRRSACDRCRGFKLRCERDQVNGRSCERCLKAQVVCTTSVGQPIQTFLPPRKDIYSFSKSRPENTKSQNIPPALVHRSSGSRVRKTLASGGARRRTEQEKFNSWIDPGIFPFQSNDDIYCLPEAKGIQVQPESYPEFTFESCNHDCLPWNDDVFYPVSYFTIKNGVNI